jgi:hypothetical protein
MGRLLQDHPPHAVTGRNGTFSWTFFPSCATGICDVVAHVQGGKYSLKVTLRPAGGVYRGRTVANLGPCGPRGSSIADPAMVKFRVRVTNAVGEGQAWTAISLKGTMAGSYKYVSAATFYCPAGSFKAALSGNPH